MNEVETEPCVNDDKIRHQNVSISIFKGFVKEIKILYFILIIITLFLSKMWEETLYRCSLYVENTSYIR